MHDAVNFWFFGLAKRGLIRKGEGFSDIASIRLWARGLNLLDESGEVPMWLIRIAQDPEAIEEEYSSHRMSTRYTLPLAALPNKPPEAPSDAKKRASLGLVLTFFAPEKQTSVEPPETEKRLAELLESAAVELRDELEFDPARESPSNAQKRITKVFKKWLDIQILWCRYRHRAGRLRYLSRREQELFIRFQCELIPVRNLVGNVRAQDSRKSLESTVRKTLKRVAERLDIPLRREVSGRPRKTLEST